MEIRENYEILKTNLQPFFWRKVKNIIRQNKKAALQEFLFGSDSGESYQGSSPRVKILEDQIQALQKSYDALRSQVESLQQKIIQLDKNQTLNFKKGLSELLKASKDTKTIQQSDYTLEVKKGPYLPENDSEVRDSTSRGKDMESKSFAEAPRSPLKPLSGSQQYNLSSASQIPKFK